MPLTDPRLAEAALTVNDAIVNRSIRHAVFMQRYSTQEVNKIVTLLNRDVFPKILDTVSRRLAGITKTGIAPGPVTNQKLRELAVAIRAQTIGGWVNAGKTLRKDLSELAISEANFAARMVSGLMPFDVDMVTPPTPLLRSLVTTRPMEGKFLRTWWHGLQANTQGRVMQSVRTGITLGSSIDSMVAELRGTRAAKFTDGILHITRRHAETIVRTAVRHTSAQAQAETAKANKDVVKEEKWLSTLDHRTSQICQSLDGRRFKVGEGIYPPAHHQCRSIRVMITKSWKEMGIDLKDPPPSTRAARDYKGGIKKAVRGEVPKDTTYGQWFKKQPIAVQNEIMGPGKAKLFRRGKVPMERFIDSKARPLTLKQLTALENKLDGKIIKPPRLPGQVPPGGVKPSPAVPSATPQYKEILNKGLKTNSEHSLVVDKTGKVLTRSSGEHGAVDAGKHPKINKSGSKLELVHNHPDSSVLSPQDFKAFDTYQGVDKITAIGHDGKIHTARILGNRRTLSKAVDSELVKINVTIGDKAAEFGELTSKNRKFLKQERFELMSKVGRTMEKRGLVSLESTELTVLEEEIATAAKKGTTKSATPAELVTRKLTNRNKELIKSSEFTSQTEWEKWMNDRKFFKQRMAPLADWVEDGYKLMRPTMLTSELCARYPVECADAKFLQNAILKSPKVKKTLYRGLAKLDKVQIEKSFQTGGTIELDTLTSFTDSRKVGEHFAGRRPSQYSVLFKVETNLGTNVKNLFKVAQEESEWIVPKGAGFRIKSMKLIESKKRYEILLEQIAL